MTIAPDKRHFLMLSVVSTFKPFDIILVMTPIKSHPHVTNQISIPTKAVEYVNSPNQIFSSNLVIIDELCFNNNWNLRFL